MLPPVSNLVSVEMIRDGGSLSAKFGSDAGTRYILLFPLRMVQLGRPMKEGMVRHKRLGYGQPVLIDCDPAKRPPNTDRQFYSELGGPRVAVTWAGARVMIGDMRRFAADLREKPSEWFNMMEFVANNDGRLPPGMR